MFVVAEAKEIAEIESVVNFHCIYWCASSFEVCAKVVRAPG